MRSTHYHVTQHGRRSRPIKHKALADRECLALAGAYGTPSGFLPQVESCYDAACIDPPILSQAVGRPEAARIRERDTWPWG